MLGDGDGVVAAWARVCRGQTAAFSARYIFMTIIGRTTPAGAFNSRPPLGIATNLIVNGGIPFGSPG